MPKYEFKCTHCDLVLVEEERTPESIQIVDREDGMHCPLHDPDLCPKDFKRVYSFAGTVFKGSGFYSIDKRKTDGGTVGVDP